jgi:hypothetical protein
MKITTFAKVLRKLLTYHLLLILLISRIGIPVYSHVCHDMAESWTSLFLPANACCSWTFQENGHGCCSATVASCATAIEAAPCCENRTELLALNSGFVLLAQTFSKAQFNHVDATFFTLPGIAMIGKSHQPILDSKSHGPPMALHGRSLLIAEQVFRC